MSWLHCMWGLGATLGPYIMGYALTGPAGWPAGYRYVAYLQLALTLVLFLSLPLWRSKARQDAPAQAPAPALTLGQVLRIPGVKAVMVCFFCYCGLEQAAGLWVSTYLTLHDGLSPQAAASYASMFFIGITLGRALSGFLTIRLRDPQMIRLGCWVIGAGILFFFLPGSSAMTLAGLILVGLGCAPIYPCIIHARLFRRGPLPGHHRRPNGQRLCGDLAYAPPVRLASQPYLRIPAPLFPPLPAAAHGLCPPAAGKAYGPVTAGVAGGAAAFGRPSAGQTKGPREPLAPAALCARCARPPPPLRAQRFFAAFSRKGLFSRSRPAS